MIETTGVSAIGVHGRTKDQRPNDENNCDAIKQIVHSVKVPIIANGGSSNNRNSPLNTYQGIKQFWKESEASSVMLARAAEWNVSVFQDREKLVDIMTVIHQYLDISIHYDYPFLIVKYCVQQMLGSMQTETEMGRKFLESATMPDLCKVFGLESAYRSRQKELGFDDVADHIYSARSEVNKNEKPLVEGLAVTEVFCPFIRAHYGPDNCNDLPKSRLLNYTRLKLLEAPLYKVYQEDKKFRDIVEVDGVSFSSLSWEKNKRYAEQAAAIVANLSLGINTPEFPELKKNNSNNNIDSNENKSS
jgi:tRNA-dihydrouridine synthase 2